MARSVKLAKEVMEYVESESRRQSRSLAGQITHCIRIARAVEEAGSFDYRRIDKVLEAELSPDALGPEEQAVWFDRFASQMTTPGDAERDFFANRKKLGRGVGMNSTGELVYQETQAE